MEVIRLKKILLIMLILMISGCNLRYPTSRCVQTCNDCNDNESCVNYISAFCPHGCIKHQNYFEVINMSNMSDRPDYSFFANTTISFVSTVTLPCNNITLLFIENNFSINTTAKEVCDMFRNQ